MSAQVGMAGSTKVGKWCMVAGQAGFAGHIHISDKTLIGAKSGLMKDTQPGEKVMGYPAINHLKFMKARALDTKLPEMYLQIATLQRELDELKEKMKD